MDCHLQNQKLKAVFSLPQDAKLQPLDKLYPLSAISGFDHELLTLLLWTCLNTYAFE